jgi:hypothetical protein
MRPNEIGRPPTKESAPSDPSLATKTKSSPIIMRIVSSQLPPPRSIVARHWFRNLEELAA